MKCCRCGRDRFGDAVFPRRGWFTNWRNGRFWMCRGCMDALIGWWLELVDGGGDVEDGIGREEIE